MVTSKIDRLFGSKTRVSLLSKLLMNPDKSFHIRGLSSELEIPYSMVYKEEKNLVNLGVLVEERKGKVTLLSVNKRLPYFTELKGLIMKTAALGDLLRSALSEVKGIRYALIYGSFAKGTERERSDVDLLVVADIEEDKLVRVVSEVERKTGREVNYNLWTDKEFAEKVRNPVPLIREIAKTPVIMIVGDENELKRAVAKRTD